MRRNYPVVYSIDLSVSKPEVLYYPARNYLADMREYGVRNVMDLSDPDFKVFARERDAKAFLRRYMREYRNLSNERICQSRDLPAMLYKRRYIVQALLGEKKCTVRHYRKPWKPGQLFNLHDQTYFLTVRLTRITEFKEEGETLYRYDYEIPNRRKGIA